MAYIDCKLKSQILGTTVGVKLYFPTDLPADVGYTVKGVLTLLHGYTNSGDDWMQMTAAPRYAAAHPGAEFGPKGLAVRQLKRHASWVQNVVRQFGLYPLRSLES